jgi:hypothetical protein
MVFDAQDRSLALFKGTFLQMCSHCPVDPVGPQASIRMGEGGGREPGRASSGSASSSRVCNLRAVSNNTVALSGACAKALVQNDLQCYSCCLCIRSSQMTKGQTSRIAVLFTTLALSACGSQGAQPEQISEGGDPQTPATPPVVETPRQSTNSEGGNTPTAGTEPVVEVPRTNSEDGERSPARSPPVVEETRQSTASGKVSTSLRLTLTYSRVTSSLLFF